jgi:hypothetical protein
MTTTSQFNLTHPSTPTLQVETPWVVITLADPEHRLLSAMAVDDGFVGEGRSTIRNGRGPNPRLAPETRARACHQWLGLAEQWRRGGVRGREEWRSGEWVVGWGT